MTVHRPHFGERLNRTLLAYKQAQGEDRGPHLRALHTLASDIADAVIDKKKSGNIEPAQQEMLIGTLLEEMARKDKPDENETIQQILHVLVADSWQKGKANTFVLPVIKGLIQAGDEEYEAAAAMGDLFHPNIYDTSKQIMEGYGSEYQLSDQDAMGLGDFLFDTLDPAKPWHKGRVWAFNAYIESFEKLKNPSPDVYRYLHSKARAGGIRPIIEGYQAMKADITQPYPAGLNTHQQRVYDQTLGNLYKFV